MTRIYKYLRHCLKLYFSSWSIPSAVMFAVVLLMLAILAFIHPNACPTLIFLIFLLSLLALAGVFIAAVWNLIKKRCFAGLVNLIMFLVSALAVFFMCGMIFFAGMMSPSEDGFADHLKIPEGIPLENPLTQIENISSEDSEKDAFQKAMLTAVKKGGGNNATIVADISALSVLYQKHPALLKRYTALSPAWRLFKEDKKHFATRRWKFQNSWHYTLHGYYTKNTLNGWTSGSTPYFQTRLTLGFDGTPWAPNLSGTTAFNPGKTSTLNISKGNGALESH